MKGEDSQFSLGEILAIREYGHGDGNYDGDGYGDGWWYGYNGYGNGQGDGVVGDGNGGGSCKSITPTPNTLKFIKGEVEFKIKDNLIIAKEKI